MAAVFVVGGVVLDANRQLEHNNAGVALTACFLAPTHPKLRMLQN